MAVTLVSITQGRKGKVAGKKEGEKNPTFTYQGIGRLELEKDENGVIVKDSDGNAVERLVTAGVLTSVQECLEISNGDMQDVCDCYAEGKNRQLARLASDVLAQFISPAWSTAQTATFRAAVNSLVKLGLPFDTAVETAKNSPALKS